MDVASALKAEILRLARKVVRQDTEALRSGLAIQRKQIIELKRQMAALEKQVGRLPSERPNKAAPERAEGVEARKPRFTPEMVKKDRARLGLSQTQYAILIGVSPQSVFNYESGSAAPRRDTLNAIAALRSVGKREALARLEATTAQ